MGLDMYLEKRFYVGNNYKKPEDQIQINVKGVKQDRVTYIIENVGYWRKANAVHQWFVENVQDGEDDCKEHYVDPEKLEELLDTVNKVLAASELVEGEVTNGYSYENGVKTPNIEKGKYIKDPTVAKELLPTASGFFFGATEYDQWYYEDLVHTKEVLETAIKEGKDGSEFYYQSSW